MIRFTPLVLLLVVASQVQDARVIPAVDPGAYEVNAAVLRRRGPARTANAPRLVIARETDAHSRCPPSGGPTTGEWAQVLDAYHSANATPHAIAPSRIADVAYDVVPRAQIMAFFEKGNLFGAWKRFYERFPKSGGYTSPSNVGFNAARTKAVVSVSHSCGGRCGEGRYYFVERVDGVWKEQKPYANLCFWVS